MKIKSMRINNAEEVILSDVTLIVGANATGKTTLLRVLYEASLGRQNLWPIQIEHSSLIDDEDLKCVLDNMVFNWPNKQYSYHLVKGVFPPELTISKEDYDFYKATSDVGPIKEKYKNYVNELPRYLIHHLGAEDRLSSIPPILVADNSTNMDYFKPEELFNAIDKNRAFINAHLSELFSRKIMLTTSSLLGGRGELWAVDAQAEDLNLPTRLYEVNNHVWQYKKTNNAIRLDFEAHGVRAFLNIIFYYILPISKVLMIDEPELFLYPSIRRKFGRMIAELSKKAVGKKQFICVTHDSDFMQGVIDARCDVQILKLAKKSDKYCYTKCLFDKKHRPKENQNVDSFIQIPFLNCVLLVEGADDRFIYEHVLSRNSVLKKYEYKLISVFGANNITNAEWMSRKFDVPYVIILDFDVIKDNCIGKKGKENGKLLRLQCVKDSNALKNKVINISDKLKNIVNIKNRGLRAIKDGSLKKEVSDFLLELKELGVFIVPVGEVESWGNLECSKDEFPEKFFDCYVPKKDAFKELDNFANEIAQYLDQKLRQKTSSSFGISESK